MRPRLPIHLFLAFVLEKYCFHATKLAFFIAPVYHHHNLQYIVQFYTTDYYSLLRDNINHEAFELVTTLKLESHHNFHFCEMAPAVNLMNWKEATHCVESSSQKTISEITIFLSRLSKKCPRSTIYIANVHCQLTFNTLSTCHCTSFPNG